MSSKKHHKKAHKNKLHKQLIKAKKRIEAPIRIPAGGQNLEPTKQEESVPEQAATIENIPAMPQKDSADDALNSDRSWLVSPKLFGRIYASVAAVLLLASTVWWAILGAKIEQGNADQLVNSYLFDNAATFHGAAFPAAHTFLIKWPLFWLVHILGSTTAAFMAMTITVTTITVVLFAFMLYRINHRPMVYGTLFLALASVLMLVPPQPYAGGLLPVNMAMITTRNLEYVVYIAALLGIIRYGWKRPGFWMATVLLGLLAASDKLFLTFSIGAALLSLVVATALRRKQHVRLSLRWAVASVGALLFSTALLYAINGLHLTHIVGDAAASPYGFIHTPKQGMLGVIFGVLNVLTNVGANPAFDAAVLRDIPHLAAGRLFGPSVITFAVNALILCGGLYAAGWLCLKHILRPEETEESTAAAKLSLLLCWSSVVAAGVFVATDHYYVVDARYLTLILFTIFIALATYSRRRQLTKKTLLWIGIVLAFSTAMGLFATVKTYHDDMKAYAGIQQRNALVARTLRAHPVATLVGDYWRVLPIRSASNNTVQVTPLDACNQLRSVLTSKAWEPNLSYHSFAYLLTFDKSLTNYPQCSLDQVTHMYGQPNQSTLIAGTLNKPSELLLFYDRGAHKSAPRPTPITPTSGTILPVTLDQIPFTCPAIATTMTFVAHEDDDLLFTAPNLQHDVEAGHCLRTIYLTTGDAGQDITYWQNREHGSEAAYVSMLNLPADTIWVQRTVKLNQSEFITIANPKGHANVSLIFFRLPDGNVNGQGFPATDRESLARLDSGKIDVIHTIDHQSSYTSAELIAALTSLMNTFQPTEVRTQAPYNASATHPDHSDHITTGKYAQQAFALYPNNTKSSIHYFVGYPIRDRAQNVFAVELNAKLKAFLAYAAYDPAVCHTAEQCLSLPSYGSYLTRQYETEVVPEPGE